MKAMNNPYKLYISPDRRTCEITFFFDGGMSCTMPARYYPEIEADIRRNFYAWQAHAYAYARERARIDTALDALLCVKMKEEDDHAED